jgi:hypothetical protein
MNRLDVDSINVFISYSHDSTEHMERVLTLANRLRAEGVDCHLDQYEESPPEGWARWTLNEIESAASVLLVCTERYGLRFRGKTENGEGRGVKWESSVITQEIYDAEQHNTKFIPVLFSSQDTAHVPTALRGSTYYDISTEVGYETLYRRLTHQPGTTKPPLGEPRPLPPLERSHDFIVATRLNLENGKKQPTEANAKQRLSQIAEAQRRIRASWIFGSVLLVFFIYAFLSGQENLPEYKVRMLAFVSALIAGLFGFFLTGDMNLDIHWAHSRFGEVGVKAIGGFALFVLVLIFWFSPLSPMKSAPVPISNYRVHLSFVDKDKRPVQATYVESSLGEAVKVGDTWEINIPANKLPAHKTVTISARTESPPLFGRIDRKLGNLIDEAAQIQLDRDRSFGVHGVVVEQGLSDDIRLPDAVVRINGSLDETRTDKNGNFSFPPNWGKSEQIYLTAEKQGYQPVREQVYAVADQQGAYIVLQRK